MVNHRKEMKANLELERFWVGTLRNKQHVLETTL